MIIFAHFGQKNGEAVILSPPNTFTAGVTQEGSEKNWIKSI